MGTLASSQAVTDRIGPFANSTIISSEGIIDRYITNAEKIICAETKREWISEYSDVEAEIKGELESCTAAKAARDIIMFDMSGFSTSAQAITMLNVNETEFQRTLKALKDQDIVKLRSVNQ